MFMSEQEIIQRLKEEREFGSRYPVRFVFVEDRERYFTLENRLKGQCDLTLELAEFCSGPDVFPKFDRLIRKIQEEEDKHILILSMGEYMRFAIGRETNKERAEIPNLWSMQQPASSRRRVIVPMLFCRDLWDRVMPFVDERQIDFIWELKSLSTNSPPDRLKSPDPYKLEVYSSEFSGALSGSPHISGLKEWLGKWSLMVGRGERKFKLLTNLWKNSERMVAAVDVTVVSNVFEYVEKSLRDGHLLKKEWGNDNMWSSLSKRLIHGGEIAETINKSLNTYHFDPLAFLGRWSLITEFERWLVWLWYRLNPHENYYGYAIGKAEKPEEIEEALINSIFSCMDKKEWVEERLKAIRALKKRDMPKSFFSKLERLSSEDKFALLSCTTHSERAYAVKTTSEALRKGANFKALAAPLKKTYPLLWDYVTQEDERLGRELGIYLEWYRMHKLKNELPADANQRVRTVDLDYFISRYSELKKYDRPDSFFLWVDGMGAEWLPLLVSRIEGAGVADKVEAKIVIALAPTETRHNAQWKEMKALYEKIDVMDELAHGGTHDDKDYFSCIARQLDEIERIANMAIELFKRHDVVVITADHGTSRLAALSFHKLPGFTAPTDSVVMSYGRYCEVSPSVTPESLPQDAYLVERDGKLYSVFKNHEHYSQSGNAAGKSGSDYARVGEIHGGATPEEILVPVIVLKRKTALPISFKLVNQSVFRDQGGAILEVVFSKGIGALSACAGSLKARCVLGGSGIEWRLFFEGIDLGSHLLQLEADGKLLDETAFEVKARGITEDDFFGD